MQSPGERSAMNQQAVEDVMLTDHEDAMSAMSEMEEGLARKKATSQSGFCCCCKWVSHQLGRDRSIKKLSFRDRWAYRTLYTDWFVEWNSPFMRYCAQKQQVKPEYLHFISDEERGENLHRKWCTEMKNTGKGIKQTAWKLTIKGMLKYGFQLVIVELCTIAAIYIIRLIIDYLHEHNTPFVNYNWFLLLTFTLFRFAAILVRNYYDLHVYNYYRYV